MEPGQEQQLAVMAALSDGSERDVTDDARFDTLNEGVATVRPVGAGQDGRQGRGQHHGPLPGPGRDGPAHGPVRPREAV